MSFENLLSERTKVITPSAIREMFKVISRPEIISRFSCIAV